MGDWLPARTNAHAPLQTIGIGAAGDFIKPAGANGFFLGADGPFFVTFDGTTASATNGLYIDPGKGGVGLMPITPNGKINIFNNGAQPLKVEVAWLENTES